MKKALVLLALLLGLRPPAGGQAVPPAAAPQATVNFNFDQVDLRLLVRLVGEMTGRRFVLDESLAGKVTVITPRPIPVEEAYPLLASILEASGFTVAEQGGTHRVIKLAEGPLSGVPVDAGTNGTQEAAGLLTKVIQVQNVSVLEVRKALEPLVRNGKNGALSAFAPGNHLIITDTASAIRQIEKVLAELDRPGAAREIEVIPLQHASAADLARQ